MIAQESTKVEYMRTSVETTFVVWLLSATWESNMSFIWLEIGFSLPQGAVAGLMG